MIMPFSHIFSAVILFILPFFLIHNGLYDRLDDDLQIPQLTHFVQVILILFVKVAKLDGVSRLQILFQGRWPCKRLFRKS